MPPSRNNTTEAKAQTFNEPSLYSDITDVYICIFFDGTANNMYEQLNKGDHLRYLTLRAQKDNPVIIQYSANPNLFTHVEKANYGMNNFHEQRIQAEDDFTINNKRGSKDSTDIINNGGLKYSNVAILRSITKRHKGKLQEQNKKTGINYNLYIEGSGSKWDKDSDPVGLGMGTGRTGVVGLVSKAVVFVGNFLHSHIEKGLRESVNIHFAVFGFSRGSTCGRVFSYLAARGRRGKNLYREKEFAQYMPLNKKYYNSGRVCLFDTYKNTTVDFLGIYDTVSAIGFIAKDDNSANNGLNQLVPHSINGKTWYVNWMHGQKFGNIFYPNQINQKAVSVGEALNQKGGSNGTSSEGDVSFFGKVTKQASAALGGLVSMAGYAVGSVQNIPGATIGAIVTKSFFGDAKWNFHRENAKEYGLFSHTLSNVKHTFHICAMDEFRENFALVDLGLNLGNHCTEVFMPGCHSDIGGGIMKDENLAKYTLRTKIGNKPTVMVTSPDPRLFDHTKTTGTTAINNSTLLEQDLISLGWLQNSENTNLFQATKETASLTVSKMAYGAGTALNGFVSGLGGYIHPSLNSGPLTPDSISKIADGYNHSRDSINELQEIKKIAQGITLGIQNSSEGVDVYYNKKEDKIEFKRFAMEGYSNITLEMMFDRALSSKVGLRSQGWPDQFLPFGGQSQHKNGKSKLPERFQITKSHKGSLGYYKSHLLKNYEPDEEHVRVFLIPDNLDYKELRKNYLHFSCTDELNAEQMIENGYLDKDLFTTVGANLGNPPNWLQRKNDFLLCRIIYRGDNSDDNLHYMNEYLQTS